MEYRRNTLEEKRGKFHSCLLWKSRAIDALLYSFQNMNTVREELHLFDDPFRMILEVHEEYHQLIEDKVRQEEDDAWFDKLDKNRYLKENPSNHHLERNHTQVDLHQNPPDHNPATHQPKKEPWLKGFKLQI